MKMLRGRLHEPGLASDRLTRARHGSTFATLNMFNFFCSLFSGRLHEPGLDANPGQVAKPGQPFSSQTPVTVYMNPLSAPGQRFLPGNPFRYPG